MQNRENSVFRNISNLGAFSENDEQNIVDEFMKFSKIGFSIERFTADFSQFSGTTVKICLYGGRLGTRHHFQAFQRFS